MTKISISQNFSPKCYFWKQTTDSWWAWSNCIGNMPRVLEFLLLKLSKFFALKKTAHFFAYCRYTVASPNFLFIPYNVQCQGFKMSTWSFNCIKFCWTYGVQYVGTPVKINPSGSRKNFGGNSNFWKISVYAKKIAKESRICVQNFMKIVRKGAEIFKFKNARNSWDTLY